MWHMLQKAYARTAIINYTSSSKRIEATSSLLVHTTLPAKEETSKLTQWTCADSAAGRKAFSKLTQLNVSTPIVRTTWKGTVSNATSRGLSSQGGNTYKITTLANSPARILLARTASKYALTLITCASSVAGPKVSTSHMQQSARTQIDPTKVRVSVPSAIGHTIITIKAIAILVMSQ